MTVTAQWDGNTGNTISFAGATISSQTWTTSNASQDKTFTIPTKTGYKLPTTMPAYNDEIYAKWTINQYTIYFEENGGSLVNDITQNYLSAVNAPTDPTREGYNFAGWISWSINC